MRSTTSGHRTLLHPTVTYPYYSCLVSSNTTVDLPERYSTISGVAFTVATHSSVLMHKTGLIDEVWKLGEGGTSPEEFKVKFKRHCKSAENTWRDFGFELANYFNEWISGLKIYDFVRLKQLVIVEQMKEQVSRDIQQHFIDDWSRIVTVDDLTEKLDDYENARQYNQATKATLSQPYRNSYRENLACAIEDVIHLVKDIDKN
ncbi:retrovirus-related Pol polyprotein from transposon opus [Trichonephila clavipes]|nr:retrovirus-related Pol polyprotein from transposon opus [Trichonephila clavipes]